MGIYSSNLLPFYLKSVKVESDEHRFSFVCRINQKPSFKVSLRKNEGDKKRITWTDASENDWITSPNIELDVSKNNLCIVQLVRLCSR